MYVTWVAPLSARTMVPSVPVTDASPVGVSPAGIVRAGQFVRQPPVQALVPLPATSLVNVYRVIPFEAATMSVPCDPITLPMTA